MATYDEQARDFQNSPAYKATLKRSLELYPLRGSEAAIAPTQEAAVPTTTSPSRRPVIAYEITTITEEPIAA